MQMCRLNRHIFFLVLILCPIFVFAQETEEEEETLPEDQEGFIFRPTIGLGVGTFTFMGDVGLYNKGYHPTVSRMGYNLTVFNPLTPEIGLNFYAIFGTVSSSERSLTRNLNFQSQIRTGGMVLSYNFGHFLPEKRFLEPYVFAGIESFEFLTKTDLYDRFGNRYNYWSDGSIRNIAENDPNAATAMIIHRDYHYETNVRESNVDGFGKYPERSWAVPVGIGFSMNLNRRWTLKMSTSMHFAFTDLVDGVSDASLGPRQGDGKNDRFLYTTTTLTYDLQRLGSSKKKKEDGMIDEEMEDYLARDTVDTDRDGIPDFVDDCAWTPKGVEIDKRGCPVDKDKDLVFDYLDDELPTPKGNLVDLKGVTVTDEDLYERWLRYSDTTGKYVVFETIREDGYFGYTTTSKPKTTFVVVISNEQKSVSPDELRKYLSMRDFKTVKSNDTIYYVVGDYLSAEEAKVRQNEIEELGISTEGVAQSSTKNTREGTQTTITKIPDDKLPKNTNTTQPHDKDVTFRVQVGAFTKPVSQEVFKDVPGLLVVKGPDGITRYYSGSYKTFGEAAEHKLKLDMQGYSGAFVVAYKEGERKNLEEVGATLSEGTKSSELNIDEKTDINKPVVDAGLVKYKIEVGRYKNDIPTEVLDMFLDLGKVLPRRAENGDVVYLYGEFSTIKEAEAALKAAQNAGLKKALIIGDFNGKIISAEEAKSLLRQ